ncbi:hypothetical protein BN159_1153 [Streptomyces davaonensis JCM 4913]|uniref:SRPBCC domain-containing protein n=1 Tax=Streptomyces davaonensis (strain DSM 101723 / JCM 4913 / KCC S-0913 / 768) TaxID=1214101 RepID=K4QX76_STRDJ|nr:hypothetical protein [Streptomyces davaonensis]CCK25532.1 hypothetical protein BN159_1153 [Streptomyces davaonensis JCM 4913]
MTTQPAINWPDKYLPGTGDNFVSNEVIVQGLTAAQVWHPLTDTATWASYLDHITAIAFPEGGGPVLKDGVHFTFEPVGVASVSTQFARVVECRAPAEGAAGRLSWTAEQDGTPEQRLEVLHGWLVEDLPGGRVRVLTQETQIGRIATDLAAQLPNPMLNAHQNWLNRLTDFSAAHGR